MQNKQQQTTNNRLNTIASLLGCGLLVGMAAGCATQDYDRGAQASDVINSAASQSASLNTQITASVEALGALADQSQGDLRTHYVALSDAVKNLQTGLDQLNGKVTQAQSQAEGYLKNWDQSSFAIQSPDIRSISQQQRQSVSDKLSSVNNEYDETKTAVTPFMADLTGVETYLGTDLTGGGLSAISTVVSKTKADAVPLHDSLQKLQANLTALGAAMSPVVTGPGK